MNFVKTILLLVLLIVSEVYGQTKSLDFNTWTALDINYKISDKFKIQLEEQIRFYDKSTKLDEYFTQFSAFYKHSKQFKFSVGARYIANEDDLGKVTGTEQHYRIHYDASHQFKIGRYTFKNRIRYQRRNELGVTELQGDYINKYLRLKTYVKYNVKDCKLDPQFMVELFRHYQTGSLNGLTKRRFAVATNYKINKHNDVKISYVIERETKIWNPQTIHLLMVKYSYSF